MTKLICLLISDDCDSGPWRWVVPLSRLRLDPLSWCSIYELTELKLGCNLGNLG